MSKQRANQEGFRQQLAAYKQAIDDDIAAYAKHARSSTRRQYGMQACEVSDVFFDLLEADGKRIRGALVVAAYEMLGGTDRRMILRAATAFEMLHTYLLIIDDIQDRSPQRRSQSTAHVRLAAMHAGKDSAHIGISLALLAGLSGAHAAQMLLASLSVDAELRTRVLGIVNLTMITAAHGQTYDILNQYKEPSEDELTNVLLWKTAEYTFLNPLCSGMVLAGAGCEDTDAIREYALHAGQAFQIRDDILGATGGVPGKDPLDDLREGKRTVPVVYALKHTHGSDTEFLRAKLGNPDVGTDDVIALKRIIDETGAIKYASRLLDEHIGKALSSLEHSPSTWHETQKRFLANLALSLRLTFDEL